MRSKIYISLLVAFFFGGMLASSLKAQNANTYLYAPGGGGTLDPMAGASSLIGTGVDDSPSALTNIGFTFVYEGVNYTQFSVTPDGFLKLGSPVAVSQFTNSITSTTNIPKLFPMWDDMATGTTGAVNYVLTGSAPNRILKVQWFVTIPRNTTGAANSTFQLWLYETSNYIEFRYGAGNNMTSASVGINGTTATNFISITTSTAASSTATANNTNTEWPGNGTIYLFVPPVACSGTPLGGTTSSTAAAACSGVNFTLLVSGSTLATGLTYQWESSPNGTTWTDIVGATTAAYSTSQTTATWYRRKTTCAGADAWSTPLQVTMNPPTACYCPAGATSTSFEKISNVTFNTINNSSSSTAGYEDFTGVSTTVTAGASYNATVTISGPFSSDQVLIWIDFNQDGDFTDPGENVYTSPQGNGPHTGSIAIPTSATSGNTRMRVRMHDAGASVPNTTPCGTSSFGQVEDYTVNIFIPPCIITCPANITVNTDPNQCGAIVNYPAPTTSGVCGPVTSTPASGSFFPRGTTTVTATEPGGGICSFTVTVIDAQPPVITCPANITVSNTTGMCGAIVNFNATATDNCPGVVVTSVPASGSLFPTGTTTVTSTATDASGNTATCTFTVTVNDTQAPTITCPANIVQGTDPNQCGAVVNYALPAIADNCLFPGPQTLSQSNSHVVGPTIQIGCQAGGFHTANSYWRAYNLAAAGLPGAFTINTVTFGIERANANGTGTTQPVTVRLHTSAGPFPASPRTQIASQVVQVPDQTNTLFTVNLTTPPTVASNAIVVVELFTPDGRAPANNIFFIGSNDQGQTAPSYISAADCGFPNPVTIASVGFPNMHILLDIGGTVAGPNPLTLLSGIAPGGTFPVGTTTNTYRVTDVAGNTATCSFNVTVNDTQAPTITCPGNITVTTPVGSCTATVNYTVTSTDNCPGVTQVLQSGLASGSAFPLGVNTVTWRATDAAGNISTCTFTVTVLDAQLPVISSQPANVTVCTGDDATFSVTATNVLGYQWQQWNGVSWSVIPGATNSTYTVSNTNVNMNTNSYRVVLTGLCSVVISNHAKVNVNKLPTVTVQASPTPVLLPGQTTTLTATTAPSGGSYVWMLNGSPVGSGSTLAGLGIADIGTYTVVYTDPNGCVATSSAIEVTGAPSDNLYVYPNPNRGTFVVRYYNTVNEAATVNVYDSKGTRVHRQSANTTAPYTGIEINLGSAIPAGVYIVELVNSSGKQIGARRIVVEKN